MIQTIQKPDISNESSFHPAHMADLCKSGLSNKTIQDAGIKSLRPADIDRTIGYPTCAKSAYEIPYPGTDYSRYKMFYEEADKINPKTGDERPKYLAKKDSGNRLYIPPMFDKAIFEDTTQPIYITEGEKKALKATQEGIPCIAISGLWNFKKKGETGDDSLIDDFDKIDFMGRSVYIIPDNDWQRIGRDGTPKNLKIAVYKLADALINRGAKVYIVYLPELEQKIGLDDYLVNHSQQDFHKLHKTHVPPLDARINDATPETYDEYKHCIAEVKQKVERERYSRKLAKKIGNNFYTVRKDVENKVRLDRGCDDSGEETHSAMLIKAAQQYKLFHDDTKEGYAYIDNKAIKIRSSSFKQLLSKGMWDSIKKSPNSDALSQALNVVESQAVFDGECIKLSNRVAEHNGDFCYDLADGRVVKTTSKGWSIVDDNPPLFKSYSHQQPQVEPIRGGNIHKLFDFINIANDSNRLLCLVHLVGCFVPNIPHPIVHPYGDQGAGKTSFCTTQKRLVDPSKLSVIIAPKNQEEAVQILEEHYLCTFDNLSTIPDWLSDLISQACTGGGYSKRKLYTDSESIIYQIQRCVVINGVNLLISRADLMDRTILLCLERIESSKRREWKALLNEFEESLPYLLGSVFDVLSRAMAIYPTIRLSSLPRMADFVVWGSAIAQALGFKVEDFTAAYQMNIEAQNSEVINCNTLAQAVLAFMADKDLWNGTVREAFEALGKLVAVSKEDKSFPKHSNKLRGHLSRIKPNLLDYGIKLTIADYDVAHKGCPMSFQKVPKVSSLSSCIPKANTGAGLRGEDKSGINERPEGIPTVSRQPEPSKIKGSGIHEDNEHPKQTFWKDANKQSEEDIPEVEFVEVISNV